MITAAQAQVLRADTAFSRDLARVQGQIEHAARCNTGLVNVQGGSDPMRLKRELAANGFATKLVCGDAVEVRF